MMYVNYRIGWVINFFKDEVKHDIKLVINTAEHVVETTKDIVEDTAYVIKDAVTQHQSTKKREGEGQYQSNFSNRLLEEQLIQSSRLTQGRGARTDDLADCKEGITWHDTAPSVQPFYGIVTEGIPAAATTPQPSVDAMHAAKPTPTTATTTTAMSSMKGLVVNIHDALKHIRDISYTSTTTTTTTTAAAAPTRY